MSSTKQFNVSADAGLMAPNLGSGAGSNMWAAYTGVQMRMLLKFALDWTNVGSIVSAVLHIRSQNYLAYHTPNLTVERCTGAWS